MDSDIKHAVEPYLTLCRIIVNHSITPDEFERLYFRIFSSEKILFANDLFEILEALLFAIEDYCSDESIREEGDLDGDQLRDRAQLAIDEITEFFDGNDATR